MKPFLLTVILAICVSTALAQPKSYTSFRDYFVVNMNPDSLEKVVYDHKDDQVRFMHELIWLEYSRFTISNHFGNDLERIGRLAHQQKSGLGLAMHNYIMGVRYKNDDFPRSLQYFRKALTYFESTQDTAGMAHCHFALMRLNINNFGEQVGNIDDAKTHYDKVVSLVAQTSDERNRISLMPRYLFYKSHFYKERPFAETTGAYEQVIQLIKKHPEMRFMLKDLYMNLGFLYNDRQDYKNALINHELCLKNSAHCSEYNLIGVYTNLAAVYDNLGNNKKAAVYVKKILAANNPKIHINDYLMIEANFSMAISNIKLKKFEGTIPYLLTYDSLRMAYYERLKITQLLTLQTKYESEKKEAIIKTLELEKQLTENRNRLILAGLIIAILVIGIISLLAVRLRKTNFELQNLQQSRDKLYTVIAHDLREPINSLLNVGTLLRFLIRQNRSQEVEKVTQQIDLMGQQTSLLLNNLLEWGKNNYFEQRSTPQSFDAAPLLQELTQVYQGLAEAKGVLMAVVVPAHYPLTANPKDLSLIIRNLLDNSLKHTPAGGKVALTALAGQTTIQVEDNGEGIAPDQLTYIQQVFSGKRKPQVGTHGVGLGLVLINDFARRNGATLQFSSQLGQGTTVTFMMK